MGNPKILRRKYDTPSHPWQGDRIKFENDIIKKFGLKNKREVWKSQSLLRNFRQQARLLNARLRMADVQAEKERNQLLARLVNLGLLNPNSNLNDVLTLELESILNRRLQTQVYLKGLAHTPKQARQFIVHGHVSVGGRKVTIPGYLVKYVEEDTIEYNQYSSLTNELHPMRPKPKIEVTVGDGQVSRLISIDKEDKTKTAEEPDTGDKSKENTGDLTTTEETTPESPPQAEPVDKEVPEENVESDTTNEKTDSEATAKEG